ncbi:MAG: GNAT family N-acetyltransferase [Pseudomonadota bacterium]
MTPSADALVVEAAAAASWRRHETGMLDLLQDAVDGDASLGFLAPLDRDGVRTHWCLPVGEGLERGTHRAWLAFADEELIGAVVLALVGKENAPHRAMVQKLAVHRKARRRGVGAALMRALETDAKRAGRWLLELDTDDGSAAVAFYRRLGWQDVGVIPDYSLSPHGVLKGTRFFYRKLEESA